MLFPILMMFLQTIYSIWIQYIKHLLKALKTLLSDYRIQKKGKLN